MNFKREIEFNYYIFYTNIRIMKQNLYMQYVTYAKILLWCINDKWNYIDNWLNFNYNDIYKIIFNYKYLTELI